MTILIIPLTLIAVVFAYLVWYWEIRKMNNTESDSSVTPGFRKASLARFLKMIVNLFIFIMLIGLFIVTIFYAKGIRSFMQNGEPSLEYPLPIYYQTGTNAWVRDEKMNGEWEVEISNACGVLSVKSKESLILSLSMVYQNLIGFLVISCLLRKLFQSMARKQPFSMKNVKRLRWLAFFILFFGVLQECIKYTCSYYVRNTYGFSAIEIAVRLENINVDFLFWALVILVIAEVFRCGVEMKEEQDLTV